METAGRWRLCREGNALDQNVSADIGNATVFRSITMADRPASCPSLTQMSLSLRGIIRVIAMEGTQKEIRLAASHSPPPEQNIDQKIEQNGDENKDENPDRENAPTDRTENASSMKPLSKAEAASDPKEPSSSEIAFTEFFDDTTDRISGARLLMMLQTGRQKASFSKQGITIRVPRASLPKDIQNNDQIEVIIKKISDRSFSFSFCINGVSFDSLPGASVMLPYPQETAADSLYLCDESRHKNPGFRL